MNEHAEGSAKPLGAALREHRQAAKLTQAALATRAGLSVAAIRDLEQGRRLAPRITSIARLSRALDLDVAWEQELAQASLAADGIDTDDSTAMAPSTGLWMQVLGPLAAWRHGRRVHLGHPRQRAVLGLLALEPGVLVHRETIIDSLWEEGPPATAVNLVQAYVGKLRLALDPGRSPRDGDGLLVSAGTSYRLRLAAGQLDLLAFRELANRAQADHSAGDLAKARDLYARALGVWRSDPVADLDVLRAHPAVHAIARERVETVLSYAGVCDQLGQAERAIKDLRTVSASESLHEAAHARLMVALASNGEQAAALRLFDDIRQRLDDELGVWPGAQLTEAYARVLHQDLGAGPKDPDARGVGRRMGQPEVTSSPAMPTVPQQLPATAWPPCLGRAAELAAMSALLCRLTNNAGSTTISAVVGTAGIGKSSLAVHWAHHVVDHFPDGQLFVDLHGFDNSPGPLAPAEAIRGFLHALGISLDHIPAGLAVQAALYRSLLATKRALVILDNARNADQVRPLLPGAPSCMVVVTSRDQLTGLAATDGAQLLTLGVLTSTAAGELLSRRLGEERVAREPEAAAELIGFCAGLPLALSIVTARASARPGLPLASLAAELRDSRSRLDALAAGDPASDLRAVFFRSFQALTASAALMFRLLGLHPCPDISAPEAATLANLPLRRTYALLGELTRANMLAEYVPGRYCLHGLLHAYASELAEALSTLKLNAGGQEPRARPAAAFGQYNDDAHPPRPAEGGCLGSGVDTDKS